VEEGEIKPTEKAQPNADSERIQLTHPPSVSSVTGDTRVSDPLMMPPIFPSWKKESIEVKQNESGDAIPTFNLIPNTFIPRISEVCNVVYTQSKMLVDCISANMVAIYGDAIEATKRNESEKDANNLKLISEMKTGIEEKEKKLTDIDTGLDTIKESLGFEKEEQMAPIITAAATTTTTTAPDTLPNTVVNLSSECPRQSAKEKLEDIVKRIAEMKVCKLLLFLD
jgi:hypothetical protein